MANKESKKCFSLTFALKTDFWDEKKLEKIYKTAYAAYGDAYNYYRKQIEKYRNDPSYLEIMEAHKKAAEEAENEKKNLTYTKEEKETLNNLQKKYELSGSRPSAVLCKRLRNNYREILDSNMVQSVVDFVYRGVHAVMYTKDNRPAEQKKKGPRQIRKKRFQEFQTISMVANISGVVVKVINGKYYLDYKQTGRKGKVKFSIPIATNTGKEEIDNILAFNEIKYPVLKRVRTKKGWKYQVQILFSGKVERTNLTSINKRVGIDITEGHIAVVTDDYVGYQKLYAVPERQEEKIAELSSEMDKIRRELNPDNYNEDGTIKRQGSKKIKWVFSHKYRQLRNEIKVIREHNANKVSYEQNCLANKIVNTGNDIVIVKKDWASKVKRDSETTINEKTGKYNSKSSLSAKMVSNAAPAQLIEKIVMRENYIDGTVTKISDKEESIYGVDIFTGEKLPYTIDDNYYTINGKRIHRTVYYAYMMTGYDTESMKFNYEKLIKGFDNFYELYSIICQADGTVIETVYQ